MRPDGASKSYRRFAVEAVALVAFLALLGYFPTLRQGGPAAIPALFAGCLLALAASLLGTLPLVLARQGPEARKGADLIPWLLGVTALRVVLALGFALSFALSGWFAVKPLLLWLAIGHAVLLAVDTRFALGHI